MSNKQNNSQKLCEDFIQIARSAISKFPDLKHSWNVNAEKTSCSLNFPKKNEEGFNILVEVSPAGITVFTQGAHQHFDSAYSANESKITSALALVRDLLSPHMRVKEFRAGKSAYRWDIETLENDKWRREITTGLLFWNYFGRRSERIFQNNVLPGRLNSNL